MQNKTEVSIWNAQKKLQESGTFENGVLVFGTQYEKFLDGYIKIFEGELENGKRKKGKEFYSFGTVSFEGEYENGQRKRGKLYDMRNNLCFEGELNNGRYKFGKVYTPYYGRVASEGHYDEKQNLINGLRYEYHSKGSDMSFTESRVVEYEVVDIKKYRPNGTLEFAGKPNLLYGCVYNEQGNLLYVGNLSKNSTYLFHGEGSSFANDSVLYEGKWNNGRYHGKGREYRQDGSLYQEGNYRMGSLHGKGVRYQENGTDVLQKGRFIQGKFYDETLFSIRKFIETTDSSFLNKVSKQSLISFVRESYQEQIPLKCKKDAIIQRLRLLHKQREQESHELQREMEDIFGNPIEHPCVGNDGGIYDLVSMEYLFRKNEKDEYVNIPYRYDANSHRVPNFPRMKNGVCLTSYEKVQGK